MFVITCAYNMFKVNNEVRAIDLGGTEENDIVIGSFSLGELGNAIYSAAIKYNTREVHLFGQPDFAEKITNDIYIKSIEEYGDNHFNIRIN